MSPPSHDGLFYTILVGLPSPKFLHVSQLASHSNDNTKIHRCSRALSPHRCLRCRGWSSLVFWRDTPAAHLEPEQCHRTHHRVCASSPQLASLMAHLEPCLECDP